MRVRPRQLFLFGLAGICVAAAITCRSLPSLCGNDPIDEAPPPDRKHRVVVFQRDCGATTGFSTQVSLLAMDEDLPDDSGNVFSTDTNQGAAPPGPGGGPKVDVRWLSSGSVAIVHHTDARVFRSEPAIDGVRFAYSKLESDEAELDAARVRTLAAECADEQAYACRELSLLFKSGTSTIPRDWEKATRLLSAAVQLLDRQCEGKLPDACSELEVAKRELEGLSTPASAETP